MHRIPRVVRCSRAGLPARAAYIGRAAPWARLTASPLANPFRLADRDDRVARRRCLQQYWAWLYEAAEHDQDVRGELERVRGADLACCCAPAPCHGDLIVGWLLRHPPADDRAAATLAAQLAAAAVLGPADAASLAVVGSKQLPNRLVPLARAVVLDELLRLRPERVVSGGARGIDTVAATVARALGFDPPHQLVELLPTPMPDPPPAASAFQRGGFARRNHKIATTCTGLLRLASVTNPTYGSGWTADLAERLGKPVARILLDGGVP
jgi:Domain of unknown function (DUF4326)